MQESIQLALIVSSIALGAVVLVAILGFLIEKNADPDGKPQGNKG